MYLIQCVINLLHKQNDCCPPCLTLFSYQMTQHQNVRTSLNVLDNIVLLHWFTIQEFTLVNILAARLIPYIITGHLVIKTVVELCISGQTKLSSLENNASGQEQQTTAGGNVMRQEPSIKICEQFFLGEGHVHEGGS